MKTINELDVIIRSSNGKVVAGIPQIALYATADSIADALGKLEVKKKAVMDDVAAAGLVDELPLSTQPHTDLVKITGIVQFTIKTFIVVGLIFGAAIISGSILTNKIEAAVLKVAATTRLGGSEFWSKVEQKLDKLADPKNELSDEKKQKLLTAVHAIVNQWRPFVAEAELLFSPPPPPKSNQ